MKKIAIVLGTRPEAIKLLPLYKALKNSGIFSATLISTGQHREMLYQIFSFFEEKPDVELNLMTANQTLASLTSNLSTALQHCFEEQKPDLVIVQGDTTTAFVSSLIAYYNRIPVAHVEAGLRTHNKYSPFPEEVNRKLISGIADYHFAPTDKALAVLKNEGLDNIYKVGNTVVDSLLLCLQKLEMNRIAYDEKFKILRNFEKTILITGHRRESFGEGFQRICDSILRLARKYPNFLFYYPVHLNPNVRSVVLSMLSGVDNIMMSEPLPYDELIYIMSRSYLILTDSGGIQEEAPSLNIPVLIMRDTTERMEGVEAGCAILVGTDSEMICSNFIHLVENEEAYTKMSQVANPYGDGTAAENIINVLYDKLKQE
jgi:UDP-N-acetylglucosamine 2-epimerase (non-hydrolysing)